MKIVDFIRLIRRHLVLLIAIPLLIALLLLLLTRKGDYRYSSQTVLYTGLATGSSIEMDKTFNYFVTNIAFENLINIIGSRETQQEVAIRLLSQHLLLDKANPKYISQKSFDELRKIVPSSIYSYAAGIQNEFPAVNDEANRAPEPQKDGTDSTSKYGDSIQAAPLFPSAINRSAYELTVRKLTELMKSSDTNFVYKLLNYDDPHYSINAIASVKVQRIGTSDLVKLTYETDDPGICQQTLNILNEVCIKNYKAIKENRSDEVVKYFEEQLKTANEQLKKAEAKLLAFNRDNNIINYYEQSKAVAVVKEDMEVDYNNKKAQLAGHEAAIAKLEEKLNIQQLVQLKSSAVLDKKKQLGEISYAIATAEAGAQSKGSSTLNLPALQQQADVLKKDIRKSVDELYSYQNTTEGLPVKNTLNEWLNNVIEAENLRARIHVMDRRNKEFQQQYAVYAPAGANIKKIEREISVSEQGYLEILHGLNLAKLKVQDNELSANLKAIDLPYYPITPIPNKRKIIIIAAALGGALLTLAFILMTEYFDNTLKNTGKAAKDTGLEPIGILSKELLHPGVDQFPALQNRLVEIVTQNLQQQIPSRSHGKSHLVLVMSTTSREGKSVVAGNIIKELKKQDAGILLLDFSGNTGNEHTKSKFPLLHRLLGYRDPRVNSSSSFLQHPSTYLSSTEYYDCRSFTGYHSVNNIQTLLAALHIQLQKVPEYIFIELPALLEKNYPPGILSEADLSILVCRSNRIWNEADNNTLHNIKSLTGNTVRFLLNGVELKEAESILGELPKKRSCIRKKIKSLFRFQFFSKNQF